MLDVLSSDDASKIAAWREAGFLSKLECVQAVALNAWRKETSSLRGVAWRGADSDYEITSNTHLDLELCAVPREFPVRRQGQSPTRVSGGEALRLAGCASNTEPVLLVALMVAARQSGVRCEVVDSAAKFSAGLRAKIGGDPSRMCDDWSASQAGRLAEFGMEDGKSRHATFCLPTQGGGGWRCALDGQRFCIRGREKELFSLPVSEIDHAVHALFLHCAAHRARTSVPTLFATFEHALAALPPAKEKFLPGVEHVPPGGSFSKVVR